MLNRQTVEDVRELLRSFGIRATPARIAAMQTLLAAQSPMSHAELAEQLVPLGFDKATVFRNLTDLADVGLLQRTELGDHVHRFEAIDPQTPDTRSHPHFVCVRCGVIKCLRSLTDGINWSQYVGTVGNITSVLFRGECQNCASRVHDSSVNNELSGCSS